MCSNGHGVYTHLFNKVSHFSSLCQPVEKYQSCQVHTAEISPWRNYQTKATYSELSAGSLVGDVNSYQNFDQSVFSTSKSMPSEIDPDLHGQNEENSISAC
jgi:hypothetical protein